MRYGDEAGLWGAISNSPEIVLTPPVPPDTIPPAPIVDLRAAEVGESWVRLTWTAVGDDGASGQAGAYALGVLADETVADDTWADALLDLDDLPAPAPAGGPGGRYLTAPAVRPLTKRRCMTT